ncbi:MAG: DNA methyltransferase [Thermoanaerobaculia bacterium]
MDLSSFIDKWKRSGASERANKDPFLLDLCELLGVEKPGAATGDPERDHYVFERPVTLVHGGERHSIGFIDLYKRGHFVLEAKQGSDTDSMKVGTAKRGTPSWNIAMQSAFGQALAYTNTIEPPPPFILVTDIGYCFDLYASFDGTRNYRKFPDALRSRINLESLARDSEHLETLRAIFTDPGSLDPSRRSVRVTREIAGYLADLAKTLEGSGHEPEVVAKFLMRCLFTMFAEDIELLPRSLFADALRNRWVESPELFPGEVSELWRKMNEGGPLFGAGNIYKFNGGLFADPIALPLTKQQIVVLGLAAQSNWADVEPAIFGTLLERALDPKERHRLGAHYTPRAYVERLVRPTIEEPLRAEWDNVRAQVVKLVGSEAPEKNRKAVAEARAVVHEFYDKLTKTRVLDPACGTGNFLYVALDLFKRIENEVIELLDSLGDDRSLVTFGRMVTPQQFLGIEIKPWAKEIAELVLWIGWLQWQIRTRGYRSHPEEPILRDYHNIECRDAVLAYDQKVPLLDDDGNPVTRWDGETTKKHPVTGEDVPDETARTPAYRYVNPRKAEWPEAEFIVGNPPFIGNWRMRSALGDGYTEALRATHPTVPESVDFVMYWWNEAAERVRNTATQRFGLITTNSFSQTLMRKVADRHLANTPSLSIVFAVPDHPWVDTAQGAAVRIAMTVGEQGQAVGTLQTVISEEFGSADHCDIGFSSGSGRINADLTIGVATGDARQLQANNRLCSPGVKLHGAGFIVTSAEARAIGLGSFADLEKHIRPYRHGKDVMQRNRDVMVIDLDGLQIADVHYRYPAVFQWILDRVKPERDQNKERYRRENWWLFGRRNTELRTALKGLARYVTTSETAKHRVFMFLDGSILPDNMLANIALDDAFFLGVLSSQIHVTWSLAAGGRLGVGNDPRYNKTVCFDPFPFPDPDEFTKQRIRNLGEQLDAHRKRQQEQHPGLTITGMYNVLEKLRSGEALTAKEKVIHEQGLVSVLKQIHDDLDAAVFDAYGWPQTLTDEEILERLVALNAERAEEERRGIVRWLRPEYQNPGGTQAAQTAIALGEVDEEKAATATPAAKELPKWPKQLREQVSAVRDLFAAAGRPVNALSAAEIASSFKGAKKPEIAAVLEALAALGILLSFDTPDGRRWRAA